MKARASKEEATPDGARFRIEPAVGLVSGRTRIEEVGTVLGTFRSVRPIDAWPIVSAGPLRIGLGARVLGVCVGQRWAFLAHQGRLARVARFAFSPVPPPFYTLSRDGRAVWADTLARAFVDRVTTPEEGQVVEAGLHRYRKIVAACVDARVLDAATYGHSVSRESFARAICVEWTERDLVHPRYATLQHALLVGLVLGLPADKAAELVELGALLEYRLPFVDRAIARDLWIRAVNLLGMLCPEWAHASYCTRWEVTGDIDRLFKAQYARMLHGVLVREVPIEYSAGLALRELIKANPVTARASEDIRATMPLPKFDDDDDSGV